VWRDVALRQVTLTISVQFSSEIDVRAHLWPKTAPDHVDKLCGRRTFSVLDGNGSATVRCCAQLSLMSNRLLFACWSLILFPKQCDVTSSLRGQSSRSLHVRDVTRRTRRRSTTSSRR